MAQTIAGRKLNRKNGSRQQMLRSLASELIRHEQIKTTLPKARECSRLANHLISLAKKDDLNARRLVSRDIQNRDVLKKVFDVLIQRYTNRTGGFTRIFRLSSRQGDNAELVLIKLIS
ncbi:50S ribosomal protein L17 [bacterium F11]|nr:50S ribosomal protein L17 [bacterium F11]